VAYKFHAPGTRKGNKFWIVRGRIDGHQFEIQTGELSKGEAEKAAPGLVATWLTDKIAKLENPAPVAKRDDESAPKTFKRAADAYCEFVSPSRANILIINRLTGVIGDKVCSEINHKDLVDAATILYPTLKASSKNRQVMTPASAILRYAAEMKWCAPWEIKRFKEQKPETKALRPEERDLVMSVAWNAEVTALLTFLFFQGMRIGDALKLVWEKVNLDLSEFYTRIGKTDEWETKPLDPDATVALANLPVGPAGRTGRGFPLEEPRRPVPRLGED